MAWLVLNTKAEYLMQTNSSQKKPWRGHAVGEEGKENIHSVSPKEKREAVIVLACINIIGNYMPPTVAFEDKILHALY